MNYSRSFIILFIISSYSVFSQVPPAISAWIINITNAVGYGGISTNVQKVQFSANNVYVSATCIPGYDIGPWTGNPNTPANQNFVFKITRHPVQNTSALVNTALGHIGVWTNGVSIFNAKDGMSYNNAGVWNRNALFYEGSSFDDCLGHPAPNGEYHHHVNPTCLYNDKDSTHHSPIIGYAFDGFPVYGAYAFTNTDGTGSIKRMRSSYALSSSTTRTNGPPVNTTYPAGCFIEDFQVVNGLGDLDEHNGRFCKTPEYPGGIYAYFVTIDGTQKPVYPYVLGLSYYGVVQAGNTGPGSGHNTISETVELFDPTSVSVHKALGAVFIFPNPATDFINITCQSLSFTKIRILNVLGYTVKDVDVTGKDQKLDVSELATGIYFLSIQTNGDRLDQKFVISK